MIAIGKVDIGRIQAKRPKELASKTVPVATAI